ncbi:MULTISPECIES: beta-ketoacyl-ACP synthase III [unclassified Streptomyces]|uniref:beta-ketoacyl-ACP synthase III n=1 Tax=unclassified Streptomyces TaxID=2593676 RepID=UPI0016616E07|nr:MULTISPECIES: beta-ketoacyl-ACP synthase III [unclassified Streptomyces]MBD0711690.1 3-oxoacyl-ACP synthase [Streptomyces sp. CBMA291]MBD0713899.1 3-oxoacyl-ACP synthase [Streptomyces sp. CBMA370]
MPHAVLRGLGTHLPSRRITNAELATTFDTSDEWITTRTGIRERYWAPPGQSTGDLATEAGRAALKSAGLGEGAEVGLLVVATTTPDHPCPATAPDVAARLGLGHAAAYDIAAVCSGFVYALEAAANAIVAGRVERALVIGAETYSTILSPNDRTTSVIFGDGAGAVVLSRGTAEEPGRLLGFDLGSDGAGRDLIKIPAGGSRQRSGDVPTTAEDHYFTMQGKKVFAHAVRRMSESSLALLENVGWSSDEVEYLVGHQANLRILRSVAEQIGIEAERAVTNIDKVGNTSAASIPLALADAAAEGKFKTGDRLLLTAFGGGLTWGSAALIWPDVVPV